MEYGHPVASSDGHQKMEEPRTDVRSVLGDEEEHHEKKPMMTRMKNRMRKMKDSMTKKMHGHVDDHDVHDDDEHSVEAEAEHIDDGIQDSLGGKGDPLTPSSRDDRPVTLASREEGPVSLSNREERASLGGLQEPPVAPETIKDIALDADPVDPLRNRSVSRTDDGNIFDPETGNERSVSPDVLSSFRDMDISSEDEKKPSYIFDPSTTAAGVKEGEDKPSYTEKLEATATGPGVEVEAREGDEEKGSYTEDLPATSVAGEDASVSAAPAVYAEMPGHTNSGEPHDQIATPSTVPGVEVEPREGDEEEKGSYTENPATHVPAKDAAVSAVYAKMAGGAHSGEAHDQIATPESTGPVVEVEPREADEEKGSYTVDLPTMYVEVAGDDQIVTPGSTGPGVEVEPREGAEEENGSYTEKLPASVLAAKDAALPAASAVYANEASGDLSGETHNQIDTPRPVSTGPGVEIEPREGAGEEKGSYTETLPATAVTARDAAVSAASTVFDKVAGGTHSSEAHDQIATGPGVEVEPREDAEEKGSYTEKLPTTPVPAKDAVVSAASAVYAKVAGDTHSGETHDQIVTPVNTGPGVEVEPREGAEEKEGTYMEQFTGAAWAVYGKMMGAGTGGDGTEQEVSESMKKKGVEEHEVVEDKEGEVKGRIVLPEVTAGEIGVNQVVGKEGGGDGGKGMMGMFNRAVNSMVGGDGDGGSGGPAAVADGAGGGAAKERAHE